MPFYNLALGHVAQLVEHQTENLGVGGANPLVSINHRMLWLEYIKLLI